MTKAEPLTAEAADQLVRSMKAKGLIKLDEADQIAAFVRGKGITRLDPGFSGVETQAATPPAATKRKEKKDKPKKLRERKRSDFYERQKRQTKEFVTDALAMMSEIARSLGVTHHTELTPTRMAEKLNKIGYLRQVYKSTGNIERPWTNDDVSYVRTQAQELAIAEPDIAANEEKKPARPIENSEAATNDRLLEIAAG
jgi:hypothetical protein